MIEKEKKCPYVYWCGIGYASSETESVWVIRN
jgi:hypothetical protein